ncbi:MAG: hypothetical protein IH941_12470 [Acidobacteria bacterium]|nr:hypothetical protein [Acidobacteriota bacterium]
MQPERPAQTTLAFHASRIVIDVGVLLAMASMSMTFVSASSGDRSALDADAFPVIILLLPIFAVTLIPDHTRPLHPVAAWVSLAFGLAAFPYALVKMLDAGILADTLDGSVGFGARLMVIGSVVVLVGIGIGLYRNLRGLPAGGTPGRTSTFRTRSDSPTTPKTKPQQTRATDDAEAQDAAPTRLLPAVTEPETPTTPPTPAPSSQPDIVFPDTGAVAREAAAEPVAENPPLDTAERADAALDDHLMSILDPDNPEDADG